MHVVIRNKVFHQFYACDYMYMYAHMYRYMYLLYANAVLSQRWCILAKRGGIFLAKINEYNEGHNVIVLLNFYVNLFFDQSHGLQAFTPLEFLSEFS